MKNKKDICIIGSGISGISAAYLLSDSYNITLIEKENYFGGHTRTSLIKEKERNVAVDTGFIVFNEKTYPDLTKFLNLIDIEKEKSNMSLCICIDENFEYSSSNIFYQKKNFIKFPYLKIIKDIIFFYKYSSFIIKDPKIINLTIDEYFKKNNYSNDFIQYHIYPIISSIWSINISDVKNFPFYVFVKFFIDNDLFNIFTRPKWNTLKLRGRSYIDKVFEKKSINRVKNFKVEKVIRNKDSIYVYNKEEKIKYDEVIFAIHANQILEILDKPSNQEIDIFKNFKYSNNEIFLHYDENLMPNNKKIWSSWNFIGEKDNNFCLSYWMNKLQNLETKNNYFVTVNPLKKITENKIINKIEFQHPIFDINTMNIQNKLKYIQGINNTWYCGSYFGYGHHEDGIQSSISIAIKKSIKIPWKRNNFIDNRISILKDLNE